MKLSICIFTYNHEKYFARAIDSALMQKTNFDFEIVVGEDCSSDRTPEIVRTYESRYPGKVRAYCNPKNVGMMENIARTILSAKGEYIAMLDGDDHWICEEKLQKQVNVLDANKAYSLCFHDGKIISPNGQLREDTCCMYVNKSVISFEDVISSVHIPTFSIVFRRCALKNFPPDWFTSVGSFDRPLFLMLLADGWKGYYIPECWGVYRQDAGGNWTRRKYQDQYLILLEIYHAVNKHYNYAYDRAFRKGLSFITFYLAITLLNDNKSKKAKCYFRKFRRLHSNIFERRIGYYRDYFRFQLRVVQLQFMADR